ncbi:MAG: hypothetical protein WC655_19000 [Candidatus Hydrogenedentales bacterium]|jgi:hypothetical protein
MQFVITTVHGTFARGAAWTKPESNLCKALSKGLVGVVVIKPFEWTGKNTLSARMNGAAKLKEHFAHLQHEHPNAKHYIIAHSHGGNVAMYAMNDPGVASLVSGVVCMSTPFIFATRRLLGAKNDAGLSARLASVIPALALSAFQIALVAAFVYLSTIWDFEISKSWMTAIYVLVLLASMTAGVVLVEWLSAFTDRLCNSMEQPVLDSEKLLIIRSPGDEAGAALGGVQFVVWLTARLYHPIARLSRWVHEFEEKFGWANIFPKVTGNPDVNLRLAGKVLGHRPIAVSLVGGIGLAIPLSMEGSGSLWSLLLFAPLSIFLVFFMLPVLLSLASALALVLEVTVLMIQSFILLLPFGPEMATVNFYRSLSVEVSPLGSWKVNMLDDEDRSPDASEEQGLAHSRPYEDVGAFKLICDWIKSHR